MSTHICTHCFYEGKPVNPPSDAELEPQSDSAKAFDKLCRIIFALTFIPVKPIAQIIAAPFYVLIWGVKSVFHLSTKKHCPNCGLPLMVSIKSDKGWLAKRQLDLKLGAVKIEPKKDAVVAFGREVKLPEPEKPAMADEPFDDFEKPLIQLPSVEKILAEEPEPIAPQAKPETPAPIAAPQQKKIDPEAW